MRLMHKLCGPVHKFFIFVRSVATMQKTYTLSTDEVLKKLGVDETEVIDDAQFKDAKGIYHFKSNCEYKLSTFEEACTEYRFEFCSRNLCESRFSRLFHPQF